MTAWWFVDCVEWLRGSYVVTWRASVVSGWCGDVVAKLGVCGVGCWCGGGAVVWRCGGVAVWRCGGVAVWRVVE